MKNQNNKQLTGCLFLRTYYIRIQNRISFGCALSVLLIIMTAGIQPASAQWSSQTGLPIAYWDFENNTTRTTLETTVEQQINTGNTFDGKVGGVSTATARNAGAGIDVYSGTAVGSALRAGGWATSCTAGIGIGTYFQFTINTTGFTGIRITLDALTASPGLGWPYFGVTYSSDGGTVYTNVTNYTDLPGIWESGNLFTLPSAANNLSNLKIRIYGYCSDNTTSSTLAIDNLLFTATGLSTSAGIKTTLNESSLYTSTTSGTTGSQWIRYGTFTITSGSTLNMATQIYIGSASTAGAVTVNSGGTLDCGSSASQVLNAVSGALSTFTLNTGGTIIIRSTVGITTAGTATGNIQTTTRTFGAGGHYNYDHPSGSAQVTGTGLPASVSGNLTINNNVTQTNAALTVTGTTNFTVGAYSIGAGNSLTLGGPIVFGTGTVSGTTTSDLTINGSGSVTGSFVFTSGAQNLGDFTYSRAVTTTLGSNLVVNTDFNLSSGTFAQNSAATAFTVTINGNFVQTGGVYNFSSGSVQSTMTLKGNFSQTAGNTTTSGTAQDGIISYAKAGTQTYSAATPTANVFTKHAIVSGATLQLLSNLYSMGTNSTYPGSISVATGGGLDTKTFQVISDGVNCTFALNSGATLTTANTSGVESGTLGSISTSVGGTRTYNSAAHYIFNGTSAQSTNFSNSTMSNLTINNSTGVTMTGSVNVNGTLTLTSGGFGIGAGNTLTASGPVSVTSGTLSGTTTSDLTINGSGTFTGTLAYTSGSQQLQNFSLLRTTPTLTMGAVSIAGNWVNNGSLTLSGTITFNNASSNTVSGSSVTPFTSIIVNKGTDNSNVLEVTSPVTISTALTLSNGTFKWSNSGSVNLTTGSLTVGATTKLWVNGGTVKVGATSGSITLTGVLEVSAGTLNVGTLTGNSINYVAGSTILFDGGNVNVTGRIGRNTTGATTTYNQSAGTVTVVTIGSTSTSFAGFDIGATGSSFTMSNGTIIIQGVTSNSTDYLNLASTNSVTGGTIQIGNGSTAASQNFRVNSSVSLYNSSINSFNTPRATLVTNNLTVNNSLSLNGGTITTGSLKVIVPAGGSVTRTSGHVNGNLQAGFNTGSGQSKLFHVGDAAVYAPVSLNNLDVSSAGNLTAFTSSGANPSENNPVTNASGINTGARADRYWTMSAAGGFAMTNADATFDYSTSTLSGTPTSYVVRKFDSPSTWSATSGSSNGSSATVTGLISFSEFEVGEPNTISVASNPSDATICDNGGTNFSVSSTSSPAPFIQWQEDNGGGFSNLTNTGIYSGVFTGTLNIANVNTGMNNYKYRAVISNINGTSNSTQATLTVNARPTGALSGTTAICNGGSESISVNVTGTGPWSGILSPGAIPFSGSSSPISVSVSPSSNTIYTVATLADANCTSTGADLTGSQTVNVNAHPTGALSGTQFICPSGTATLSIAATGSGTISGTLNPGAIPYSGTAPTITAGVTPGAMTTYSINTMSDANCTSDPGDISGSATVSIYTTSTAPTSVTSDDANNELCSGQNIMLTANGGAFGDAPGSSYKWYEGGCGTGGALGSSSTLTVTNPSVGSHTYYARIEDACGNTTCSSITILVTGATPANTVGTPGAPSEACSGPTGILITVNAVGGPNIQYSWTTGSSSGIVLFGTSAGGPFSPPPFLTATNQVYAQFGAMSSGQSGYNICVQGTNACGSTNNKCVFIRGKVSVPGTITPAANAVACPSDVKSYTCGVSGGASVYNWTLNGSPTAITSGQGTTNATVTYPVGFAGGQLCVTAALSCGGSSTSSQRCMTITNAPAVPGTMTGPSSICPGATGVTFSVPAVAGASGYNWTTPVGTTITGGQNTTSITVSFPASYTGAPPVCVSATSACGSSVARCKTVGSSVPLQPGAMNGPTTNVCNSTVQYSIAPVTNAGGPTPYIWTNPAGTTITSGQGSTTILLSVSPSFSSGFLTVTANTNLCSPGSSPARTITIYGKPNTPGTITPSPASWCNGGFVNFSSPTVSPLPTYNWVVSNGTITAGQGSNNIDVTWGTGTGNVTVNATNSCGVSSNRVQSFTGIECREEGISSTGTAFSAYPNPAHDKVTVSIDIKESADFTMQLMDLSGRVVVSEGLSGSAGLNTYDFNLSHLSKGVYMLELKSAEDNWKTKVVVQ